MKHNLNGGLVYSGTGVEEAVAAVEVQVDLVATEVVQVVMDLVDLVVKDLVDKNIIQ